MSSVAVVAMDIHKRFSKAVTFDTEGTVVETQTVGHQSHDTMRAFLQQFAQGTPVIMEATFNWPWITDLAEAVGLAPHLAHPLRAREMAAGMAKTDRKDAIFLGRLWLAGDVFPEAYLAPPHVRTMRARFRTRLLLVHMRTMLKNSIHGILHKYGLLVDDATDLFGLKGRHRLTQLELPVHARSELDQKLAVLDDLTRHIQTAEQILRQELPHDPRAERLRSIPGIGPLIAYGMLAEIGELARFPCSRALAAYAGLLPLDRESAATARPKHTSRRCNHFLRWMALEAVTGAVRSSPRFQSLVERVRAKNRSMPGKARVAVAREILELVFVLLRKDQNYQEIPPARPGVSRPVSAPRPHHRASSTFVSARSSSRS